MTRDTRRIIPLQNRFKELISLREREIENGSSLKLTEGDIKPFIIGGGEIYKLFLSHADSIELTRVHGNFEADTFFPEIDYKNWELVEEEKHLSSENQPYDYSYLKFRKIK